MGDGGSGDGHKNRHRHGHGHVNGDGVGSDEASGTVPMTYGDGFDTDGLTIGPYGRRINLTGGGTNPKGGRVIPRHWPGGGGVKYGEGYYQLPHTNLHGLSWRPT